MSRRLRIAALVSVIAHLVLVVGLGIAGRRATMPNQAADQPATIELVMIEQKGAGETSAPPPPEADAPQPPRPEDAPPDQPPPAPQPNTASLPEPSPSLPPSESPGTLPPPTPSPSSPDEVATGAAMSNPPEPPPPQAPPPQASQRDAPPAPDFNFAGTDSDSNAIASGDNIIPASPDKKARNRPPIYPEAAARRGQQGAVILVIHVSPLGLAAGVDVVQSSGYAMLDRAARDAVLSWRFNPAVKDGEPIPFDMPMRFLFESN